MFYPIPSINFYNLRILISCSATHAQNGALEHKHHHILEISRTLSSHIPPQFWADIVCITVSMIKHQPYSFGIVAQKSLFGFPPLP